MPDDCVLKSRFSVQTIKGVSGFSGSLIILLIKELVNFQKEMIQTIPKYASFSQKGPSY